MSSLQFLQRRLKGVNNVNKITKAMEMVAAVKMRKAQEVALAGRPYALAAQNLMASLSKTEGYLPPLFRQRAVRKTLYLLVASDKGMAGAFNGSVAKKMEAHLSGLNTGQAKFAAVGNKAAGYLSRRGRVPEKVFRGFGDYASPEQVRPLADFLTKGFLMGNFDEVIIFSMHFYSALRQDPLARRILPVDFESIRQIIREMTPEHGKFSGNSQEEPVSQDTLNYLVEPSPRRVLKGLAAHLFFMEVYHLVLEANAAEHSARRMAMKKASDNAADLAKDITLEYNKTRQAGITREIVEITAGAQALQ